MRSAVARLALLVFLLQPSLIVAFYEKQNEQFYIDARGLLRGFINASHSPNDPLLYPDQSSAGIAGIARLMVDAELGEQWRFEFNGYQIYIPSTLATQQGSAGLPVSVERSALFEASFSNQNHLNLVMDRFVWRWSKQNVDLTLGRQAINLATTFYFTPNDFFAPFSAQTFYRVYKPGVDAVRGEISLGEFSQVSLIGVLGYQTELGSDTGWSDRPNSDRASYLVHWSNAFANLDTTLIAGRVVNKDIVGAALQGEFFEWLGVRFEGHYSRPQESHVDDYSQFSFGLEHRWENSFELRWELFYNGQGSDNVGGYSALAQSGSSQYLARRYSALGGSYEITPLLSGQAVIISNLDDRSQFVSINTIYSLSDESDMVVNLGMPVGSQPDTGVLKSEFGAYSLAINIEMRLFF